MALRYVTPCARGEQRWQSSFAGKGANWDTMRWRLLGSFANCSRLKVPSTLFEDSAPFASLDCLKARAAPTHPRAQPRHLGSLRRPQQPASGRSKAEDFPAFKHQELAKNGSLDLLRILLECGCPINAADYDKRTCLHLAASTGNLPICQLLIAQHVSVNAADRWGGTPLADAVRQGHDEVARLLQKNGAELHVNVRDASAQLCELAAAGKSEKLERLIAFNADPNTTLSLIHI